MEIVMINSTKLFHTYMIFFLLLNTHTKKIFWIMLETRQLMALIDFHNFGKNTINGAHQIFGYPYSTK